MLLVLPQGAERPFVALGECLFSNYIHFAVTLNIWRPSALCLHDMDLSDPLACSCESDNESSGPIKEGNFLTEQQSASRNNSAPWS